MSAAHAADIAHMTAVVKDLQVVIDRIAEQLGDSVPETREDLNRAMLGEEMQQLMFNSQQRALLESLQAIQTAQCDRLDQSIESFVQNEAITRSS